MCQGKWVATFDREIHNLPAVGVSHPSSPNALKPNPFCPLVGTFQVLIFTSFECTTRLGAKLLHPSHMCVRKQMKVFTLNYATISGHAPAASSQNGLSNCFRSAGISSLMTLSIVWIIFFSNLGNFVRSNAARTSLNLAELGKSPGGRWCSVCTL